MNKVERIVSMISDILTNGYLEIDRYDNEYGVNERTSRRDLREVKRLMLEYFDTEVKFADKKKDVYVYKGVKK